MAEERAVQAAASPEQQHRVLRGKPLGKLRYSSNATGQYADLYRELEEGCWAWVPPPRARPFCRRGVRRGGRDPPDYARLHRGRRAQRVLLV